MMPNPELSQRIRALPEGLFDLEREPGTAEHLRRIDAWRRKATCAAKPTWPTDSEKHCGRTSIRARRTAAPGSIAKAQHAV